MPFQPINFAGIAPQGNPALRDFIDNLSSGYKAGQMPAQMQRQRQQEEIANAFKNLQLQQEPQRFQSEQQGQGIMNAMRQLQLNEEPQRFKSSMGSAGLGNQLKQLQILTAQRDMDPEKKVAYLRQLSQAFSGMGGNGQQGDMQGSEQGQSSGMSQPSSGQGQIMQQLLRKEMGLPEQNPQDVLAQKIAFEKAKQEIQTGGSGLTTGTTTALQKQNNAIDQVFPVINDIIKSDVPSYWSELNPNLQASYKGQIGSAIDLYSKALNFMGIKDALSKAQDVLKKAPLETTAHYKGRLKGVLDELSRTKSGNEQKLKPNNETSVAPQGKIFNLDSGGWE